ncbi:hypothetical protein [Klebsiella pneumoniae]|uniref:hypothetical protein n=1 Tax=Klebsiella pneumoniae TaxID=573 RepID=UPI002DB63CE7|nr:hypothetical protein [Klebsiella pneumoniae]MEC4356488.1 hypothetical protein [Klebsiella pneumoniae]HDO6857774.1 hypothetical protein [Klebsiella pneumoniae]
MRYVKISLSVATFLLFWYVSRFFTGCSDGWGSSSIGLRGACSYHGGVSKLPIIIIFLGLIASFFVFFLFPDSESATSKKDTFPVGNKESNESIPKIKTNTHNEIKVKRELKIEIENLNDKKFSKIFIYSDGLFIKEFNPENKMKVSTKRINKNKILKISNLLREGKGGAINPILDVEAKGYLVRLFENHAHESKTYFIDRSEKQAFSDIKELINSV